MRDQTEFDRATTIFAKNLHLPPSMSQNPRIAKAAAAYGDLCKWALATRDMYNFTSARYFAKCARAEWRSFCHLTSLSAPIPHPVVDSDGWTPEDPDDD